MNAPVFTASSQPWGVPPFDLAGVATADLLPLPTGYDSPTDTCLTASRRRTGLQVPLTGRRDPFVQNSRLAAFGVTTTIAVVCPGLKLTLPTPLREDRKLLTRFWSARVAENRFL